MAEERDASAQAYVMICKGGKMWPAVRCKPPMELPSKDKLQQPTPFHICVFIPVICEFHWKMETDLSEFDNCELSKFTRADEPERFQAFWTIIELVVDENEPDYGWWASEILAHQLHQDHDENEPVNHESGDFEPETTSAARVVQGPKRRASGSMKPGGKSIQSHTTDTAKVGKSNWLSKINQEATKKLEQKDKRKKKRSIYIPDELDDEPPRPRKKMTKSSPAEASEQSDNLVLRDFSTPLG